MATKTIELTYGRKALVNEQDYEEISKYKWFAYRRKGKWFAARWEYDTLIFMHEQIAQPAEGWGVRHAEPYQTLNNIRENLVHYRLETPRPPRFPKSEYRGVTPVNLADGSTKHVARIGKNGEKIILGRFDDPVDAAKAYDRANYDMNGEEAIEVANFKDALLEYVKQVV
jgi:hypothetical protein